ncbi:MAG TPA: WbqC family protein [Elusimicrobiota bacterium]|nr:WbqC family protein [Elusimicrobiota bacterium]
MIVAAHQPNFLPWLGYFDKMRKADMFITVDHVQMERQSFQNRTRIKTAEGARWITVPVVQSSRDERVADKRVDNSREGRFRWGRKMALTLKYAYQSAPHYAEYAPALTEILEGRWDLLADLNHRLIDFCRDALKIATPMRRSSEMKIAGTRSEMVLDMCRQVGAKAYLSGAGASKGYLDVAAFERAGIEVLWQDFPHPRYEQRPPASPFIEKLSVLDLLFNRGPESAELFAGRASGSPAAPAGKPEVPA